MGKLIEIKKKDKLLAIIIKNNYETEKVLVFVSPWQ